MLSFAILPIVIGIKKCQRFSVTVYIFYDLFLLCGLSKTSPFGSVACHWLPTSLSLPLVARNAAHCSPSFCSSGPGGGRGVPGVRSAQCAPWAFAPAPLRVPPPRFGCGPRTGQCGISTLRRLQRAAQLCQPGLNKAQMERRLTAVPSLLSPCCVPLCARGAESRW